jgi:hypothetical protein
MIRCLAYAFTAIFKSRAKLVAENLCLRQQLIVLKRRQASHNSGMQIAAFGSVTATGHSKC